MRDTEKLIALRDRAAAVAGRFADAVDAFHADADALVRAGFDLYDADAEPGDAPADVEALVVDGAETRHHASICRVVPRTDFATQAIRDRWQKEDRRRTAEARARTKERLASAAPPGTAAEIAAGEFRDAD